MVRTFKLISKLKARPKTYILTKLVLNLYTIAPKLCVFETFFFFNTFGYAQRWCATLNLSQSGYGILLKTDPEIACFLQLGKIPGGQNRHTISRIHNQAQIYYYFSSLFFKQRFSILSLFIHKSCYKNMVLTLEENLVYAEIWCSH